MTNQECGLEKECITFLCDFPDRVPYRCSLCTPMVRYTLERIRGMNGTPKEEDIWRD